MGIDVTSGGWLNGARLLGLDAIALICLKGSVLELTYLHPQGGDGLVASCLPNNVLVWGLETSDRELNKGDCS